MRRSREGRAAVTENKTYGLAAIAELAGVSTATVSNVLNKPSKVKESTRQRVLDAIEATQFVPNRAAATLRQGNNRMLGLVIPEIVNQFYSEIARGAADAADRLGYGIVLCVSNDDPQRELRQFEMLARHRTSGAMVVPVHADPGRLATLRLVGSRLLLIDRVASVAEGCSVAFDDVAGGRLAVDHLLTTRGPRIALVNGQRTIPQCADRREGALLALGQHGLPASNLREYEADEMTIAAGRAIGLSLPDDLPDGIFCTNDQLALGVIRGLAERGIAVPDAVSVVGYGDLPLAAETLLTLTSVEQPKFEMGVVAVETLVDEIEHLSTHEHRVTQFQPTLVIRESAPA